MRNRQTTLNNQRRAKLAYDNNDARNFVDCEYLSSLQNDAALNPFMPSIASLSKLETLLI